MKHDYSLPFDNSSRPLRISGCNIPGSSNYNSRATINDGSCIPAVTPKGGCMNINATNFDATATFDNGTCDFSGSNVVFNTGAQKLIQSKVGANIFETETNQYPSWVARAIAVAFQTYYYTKEIKIIVPLKIY